MYYNEYDGTKGLRKSNKILMTIYKPLSALRYKYRQMLNINIVKVVNKAIMLMSLYIFTSYK